MFLIIDGNTEAKDPARLAWFLAEVRKHKNVTVDQTWLSKKNALPQTERAFLDL